MCGSAPCLFDDYDKVSPWDDVMLVNGACTALAVAEHVLSGHTDKAEMFAAARRAKFPDALPWRLHATTDSKHSNEHRRLFPSVTDWHEKDMCTGATSVAKGVRIGLKLGYERIILCGAPMDGSGYFKGEASVAHDCHRVGDADRQGHRVIQGYRRKFKNLAQTEFKGRVFSMSGFTRECLGAPEL